MCNFAWWYCTLSFTCSLHFQWPWHYFKVTAVSNNLNWKFYVIVRLSWNFEGLLSTLSRSWISPLLPPFFFNFRTYSREIIDVVANLTKTLIVDFFANTVQWVLFCFFQTLHYDNLAWGVPVHTWFDNIYIVSRSQVSES